MSTQSLVAIALYDYSARSDKELDFKKGQQFQIIEKFASGWWIGEINGKRGVFPGSYVRETVVSVPASSASPTVMNSPPVGLQRSGSTLAERSLSLSSTYLPVQAQRQTLCTVRAMYDFNGDSEKKLSFKKGDTIKVLQKLQEVGWWEGELNGRVGLFPSNYVKEIKKPDHQEESTGSNSAMMMTESSNQEQADRHTNLISASNSLSQITTISLSGTYDENVSYESTSNIMTTTLQPNDSDVTTSGGETEEDMANQQQLQQEGTTPETTFYARCMYDFTVEGENKLNFKKGETVEVTGKANEAWWKGQIGMRRGYFPANYVKVIEKRKFLSTSVLIACERDSFM